MSRLRFKRATEPSEFEQIRRLNYRTFVEEIPQHGANAEGLLADERERESTFFICVDDGRLVGMIAVGERRPFSLDRKLPDLDRHLPPARSICELRLLAVEPRRRSGVVFHGLIRQLARHCLRRGHDLAVISGTDRQLRLYRRLGFVPFGPRVGTEEARYQPMYLTLEALRERERTLFGRTRGPTPGRPARFLPGPVDTTPEVAAALSAAPLYHRDPEFDAALRRVQERLLVLTDASDVQLLLGSGTLANDVVAGQLTRLGEGLVLSHGEFGERLVDHAARWKLPHRAARKPWGAAFSPEEIAALLDESSAAWIWFALCETSTGVLTDLEAVREVCAARGVAVCVDAISAIGTVPVDLRDVRFATGVSTKGLGGPPGIALVFHDRPITPRADLPRYMDLGAYARSPGVPFTHSSHLVGALEAALACFADAPARLRAVAADAAWVRARLAAAGLQMLGGAEAEGSAVITLAVRDAAAAGTRLEQRGFQTGWRSGYLRERNWLQIALMGAYRRDRLAALVEAVVRDGG